MKLIKNTFTSLIVVCIGWSLTTSTFANVSVKNKNNYPQQEGKLNQIIVKYKNDIYLSSGASSGSGSGKLAVNPMQVQRLSTLQAVSKSFGTTFSTKRQIATGGWVYHSNASLNPSQMRALAKKLMQSDKSIEYAEPDYIRRATFAPTDPMFLPYQWDMQKNSGTNPGGMSLPEAWGLSMGKGVVVAVLDTGYRPHPDLLPNLVPSQNGVAGQYGYNFISNPDIARIELKNDATSARGFDALDLGDWVLENDPVCPQHRQSDSSWHGTHVAGIIAAAVDGHGTVGVAPSSKVLPLRVLGRCGGMDSDIADAIAWASGYSVNGVPDNTTKVNVLNLSLGGPGVCTKTTQKAMQLAMDKGMIVVVAAGNSDADAKTFSPANCLGVIVVAANDIQGAKAPYSNFGPTITVAAPGGGATKPNDLIISTISSGSTVSTDDTYYGAMVGTSQAAPHVAGVAALMLAVKPTLNQGQVKNILMSTARPTAGGCAGCGGGIVDAAAAVKAAASK
jgi:serine protease